MVLQINNRVKIKTDDVVLVAELIIGIISLVIVTGNFVLKVVGNSVEDVFAEVVKIVGVSVVDASVEHVVKFIGVSVVYVYVVANSVVGVSVVDGHKFCNSPIYISSNCL
jgi:hypothetical protein